MHLVVLAFAALLAPLTSLRAVTPLPSTVWTPPATGVTVRADGALTHVEYSLRPGARFELTPDQPLPLPADITRLALWLAAPLGETDVEFVLKDADDHTFFASVARSSAIRTNLVGADARQRDHWPVWTALESENLRNPSETELRERLTPEDARAVAASLRRPPYSLVALRFSVTTPASAWMGAHGRESGPAVREGRGHFAFRDLRAHTRHSHQAAFHAILPERNRAVRDEPLLVFPEDATATGAPGPRDFEVIVRSSYQGPVVWLHRQQLEFHPDDLAARFTAAVPLPRLAPGSYWLDVSSRVPRGLELARQQFRVLVGEGPSSPSLPPPVDPRWTWTSDQPDHVFPHDTTTATLKLLAGPRPADAYPRNARLVLTQLDAHGRELHLGEPLPLGDASLEVAVEPGRDYFARAEILQNERVLERAWLHFGVANAPLPSGRAPPPDLPNNDDFLSGRAHLHPELRLSALRRLNFPYFLTYDADNYRLFAAQAASLRADSAALKNGWRDLEPLPGVYRWEIAEEQLAALQAHGMTAIWGYTPYGGMPGIPAYLPLMLPRDQFGDFIDGRESMFGSAPWYPPQREALQRFWRATADRFVDHPAVLGYRIYTRPVRSGARTINFVTDYTAESETAYRAWSGIPSANLTRLLTVPGRRQTDLPPDLSPGWKRFTDFGTHSQAQSNRELIAAIRSIDPSRLIHLDMKHSPWAIETLLPDLKANGVTFKNEGAPHFRESFIRSIARQGGVRLLDELHRHIPSSKSIADAVDFWGSHLSDTTFWLLRWKPEDLDPENPYFLARDAATIFPWLAATRPAWEEYLSAPHETPEVLVYGSRAAAFLGGSRRGQFSDIGGSETFEALFEGHQLLAHAATEHSPWVPLDGWKLVFVGGVVLTPEHERRILDRVRSGGKIVLVGEAGKYSSDDPAARHRLRRALGDSPFMRTLPEPEVVRGLSADRWDAQRKFPEADLAAALAWAGVSRRATATHEGRSHPFQILVRKKSDDTLYLGLMRGWPGWYRDEIEFEDALVEKHGLVGGQLSVHHLPPGSSWRVEEIHRQPRDLGTFTADSQGVVKCPIRPVRAGEAHLLRLTRQP